MEARKLRVCVVGAGVSGLTALKELLEEGHSAVCLERENVPGGVFTTGADPEMAREVILRLPVVRDAVDLALVPLALAGHVEESAIPKIHQIVEQQFAADPQLI